MGFWDRFKRAPAPSGPPPASPPLAPFPAKIESLGADGVGTLRGARGEVLEFGASACKGFAPVEGARVVVTSFAPYPLGGMRPSSISLDPGDGAYDALLAARDAALGRQPPTAAQVAATSRGLATITILLD